MEQELESKVIKKSIEKTSDVANDFYKKQMVRTLRNAGCQTLTMEEIFKDYSDRVAKLV